MSTYTRLTARSLPTSTPSKSERRVSCPLKLEEPPKRRFGNRLGKRVGDEIEQENRDDAVEAEAQRIVGADLLQVITAGDRREGDGPARIVVRPVFQ